MDEFHVICTGNPLSPRSPFSPMILWPWNETNTNVIHCKFRFCNRKWIQLHPFLMGLVDLVDIVLDILDELVHLSLAVWKELLALFVVWFPNQVVIQNKPNSIEFSNQFCTIQILSIFFPIEPTNSLQFGCGRVDSHPSTIHCKSICRMILFFIWKQIKCQIFRMWFSTKYLPVLNLPAKIFHLQLLYNFENALNKMTWRQK